MHLSELLPLLCQRAQNCEKKRQQRRERETKDPDLLLRSHVSSRIEEFHQISYMRQALLIVVAFEVIVDVRTCGARCGGGGAACTGRSAGGTPYRSIRQ